ncbi:MAG TPA: Ig-like domain-containing protein [Gemmatimonadaceae bacterium]|jgi:hypothetical protein
MRFYTALALTFAFSATVGACGDTATPTVAGLGGTDTTTSGSSLAISPNQVQLLTGGSQQLTTNAPASLQNQVQWGSLQTTIAIISPSGFVTAVGAGTATITANYSSDTTDVATATVVVTGLTTP